MNILLFGGGLQILSTARSLKEKGYTVYVAAEHNEVSRKCNFVRQCIDITLDKSFTSKELLNITKEKECSVVIPMEDEYATWLSLNKEAIEAHSNIKCAIMDYATFSIASDKSKLMEFCQEHNIPHPRTMPIKDNYNELSTRIGFPSLVKPGISAGSRGIKLVHNIEELREATRETIAQYGDCSLQEFIPSNHYYNAMLYRTADGTYSNHTITKITRYYPIKGGSSSFCTSIENEAILEICKKTLDKLGWIGFADFDILEKGDGDYRIIEINPRIPASVHAAYISGVHFGEIIVKDLTEGRLPQYTYTPGKNLRCLGIDIAWFLSSPRRFNATPSWFRFCDKNTHYQEGGRHDFLAMCTSIWSGIKKQVNPEFRKQKQGMN